MNVQNLLAAANVWQRDIHLAVKPPRAQQGSIQNVRAVGGRNHDHAHVGLKTVHLDQHLVQRLLPLVIAAAQASATLAAYSVNLVDENNAGCVFLGVVKHVAYAGCAHTDEHFHKVRARDGEKRHLGFASDALG